jgi:hypothetical protein
MNKEVKITAHDRAILRELGQRLMEHAHDPIMEERRRLWRKHASLQGERPMILAETSGVVDEVMPLSALRCQEPWARQLERGLRLQLFQVEEVRDDWVLEPWLNVRWKVDLGNYGVTVEHNRADNEGKLGSYKVDPPIKDLQRDWEKLHPRVPTVDREGTLAWKATLEELFAGILPVRIRGSYWWTMGMTIVAIDLIGLDNLMLWMYDDPDGLHRLMAFLRDDHLHITQWCEREGLLTLNNENDYVGSGGIGYTTELPQPDWREGQPVRLKDLWGLSESQETVGVSPEMFAEFIMPYQKPVIEQFGLSYYGCCEPVHSRWHVIAQLSNLRSVSISPWCDQAFMAEALGRRYIFCRKPNPAIISRQVWDEEEIRQDLRYTLTVAKHCEVEFAMKDVHTLMDQPQRLGRWVEIAREEIARLW